MIVSKWRFGRLLVNIKTKWNTLRVELYILNTLVLIGLYSTDEKLTKFHFKLFEIQMKTQFCEQTKENIFFSVIA